MSLSVFRFGVKHSSQPPEPSSQPDSGQVVDQAQVQKLLQADKHKAKTFNRVVKQGDGSDGSYPTDSEISKSIKS